MTCSRELLERYLDGELDASTCAAVEQHLVDCGECSTACSDLREQRAAIHAAAPYFAAPPGFDRYVRAAIRGAAAPSSGRPLRPTPWRALALAASLLLAVSITWNLAQLHHRPAESDLSEAVLSNHVRSLLDDRLVDVPSSDRHTVKPWFAGRLDYSPLVKDLQSEGFILIGWRLEYLDGRRVAALVYRRRQHVINLYTWPAGPSPDRDQRVTHNGYNAIHWTGGGMVYWAVSDVAMADLERLHQLYEQ